MFEKLKALEDKFNEINEKLMQPETVNNTSLYTSLMKEYKTLTPIVEKFGEYKKAKAANDEALELLDAGGMDKDFKEMVQMQLEESKEDMAKLEEELKLLLLPKDPNDNKNVIMEIRAGTGGDEAGLFAADLYKMYTRYAESKGWKVEMMNSNYTDVGGFKEVTFMIVGKGAYSKLKFEGGVHRVQRVPATESSGRIHTSAATVAVLPEAEEVEVEINPNDLRIDVFCSSGPGGQSVNTTQSAVRVTHLPTGLVVSCQDEKSQQMNKEKAIKVLRSRLLEKYQQEQHGELDAQRRGMIGSGDRSERIRTYNFPQGRVSDHRINLTLHKLDQILLGNLDELIDALVTTDQAEKLKAAE